MRLIKIKKFGINEIKNCQFATNDDNVDYVDFHDATDKVNKHYLKTTL